MSAPPFLLPEVDCPGLKGFREGTHRAVPPGRTLQDVRPRMTAMGITRLANITGLDRIGIPVATACRPNSRGLAVSQGKGLTVDAAMASALMESAESYHAERIALPLRYASLDEIRREGPVVDVTLLPSCPDSLFNEHYRLLWIQGYDLLGGTHLWVPYELVGTDYTLPFPSGSGCFQATTNGLASGNHLLEAISHAICEVVERDACALWFAAKESARLRNRVNPATIDDHQCRQVLDTYKKQGIACAIWEVTSNVGLPAFRCLIAEESEDPLHPRFAADGMGCHPSSSVALLRALVEAAQCRLTYIAGSRDDIFRETYERFLNRGIADAERSEITTGNSQMSFRSNVDTGETFHDDVVIELERLRAAGIRQVVVVNLTRPELQIPVVRVVIPGMEGVCSRPDYVPGIRVRTLPGETT